MTSLIDPTKPTATHAFTADVRANFQAAKNEIEALQAQGSVTPTINLFSFLTSSQIIDALSGTLSFDASVPLQAAIDYCNTYGSYANQRSAITLIVPPGNYNLANQVIIKNHVNLHCGGVLKNGLASATTPALMFKAGSGCSRVTLDANGQTGILFGDMGVNNFISIGNARVLNGSLAVGRYAIQFIGLNFDFDILEVDGGRTGVAFGDGANAVTSIKGNKIRCFNSFDGVTVDIAVDVQVSELVLESCTNSGLTIERSSLIAFPNINAIFVDSSPGTCFASGSVISAGGAASVGIPVANVKLAANICNTGGIGATIGANIINSFFFLNVNRAALITGNAHNSTTGIAYTGAINSSFAAYLMAGAGITPTTGTVAGNLISWDGTTELHSKALSAPSLALLTGTLRGIGFGRATVDQSIASSTVLTDVTGHSFAIAANEEWLVEFTLSVGAALATTGLKVAVVTPAGATQQIDAILIPDVPTVTARDAKTTTASATALDFTAAQQTTVGAAFVRVTAWVLNGATPGTVKLQFCQSTSSVTALVIKKGAFMKADRIA